jgi:hypothetical protein
MLTANKVAVKNQIWIRAAEATVYNIAVAHLAMCIDKVETFYGTISTFC